MAKYKSHIRVSTVWMDKELLKLSPYAQLAYFWLLRYRSNGLNGGCYPPQKRLAQDMNVNERTVRRAIKELKETEKRIITIEKRKKKGAKYASNYYIVTDSMLSDHVTHSPMD